MPQMRFANRAHGFGAQHAVGRVGSLFNRLVVTRLVKTWPTAACIKFGAGLEKQIVTTHAAVNTFVPMGFIASGLGAFCRGVTRDFVGHRFGVFGSQMGAPFGAVFGKFHEEQLIEMEEAQSGGKAAKCSNDGCSSKGEDSTCNN